MITTDIYDPSTLRASIDGLRRTRLIITLSLAASALFLPAIIFLVIGLSTISLFIALAFFLSEFVTAIIMWLVMQKKIEALEFKYSSREQS